MYQCSNAACFLFVCSYTSNFKHILCHLNQVPLNTQKYCEFIVKVEFIENFRNYRVNENNANLPQFSSWKIVLTIIRRITNFCLSVLATKFHCYCIQ